MGHVRSIGHVHIATSPIMGLPWGCHGVDNMVYYLRSHVLGEGACVCVYGGGERVSHTCTCRYLKYRVAHASGGGGGGGGEVAIGTGFEII